MKILPPSLRRHLSPLAADTASMLDLPPVRMGLLAKLNLLTIGLIFLTAVAITVFYGQQRWRDDEQQLKTQGAALAAVLTELAEYALYTSDKASLSHILDGIGADPSVAFVAVLDRKQQSLDERRFVPSFARVPLPEIPSGVVLPARGQLLMLEHQVGGQKYLELIAPVANTRRPLPRRGGRRESPAAASTGPRPTRSHARRHAQAVPRADGRRHRRGEPARRVCRARDAAPDAPARGADAPPDARGARGRRGAARRLRAGRDRRTSWAF